MDVGVLTLSALFWFMYIYIYICVFYVSGRFPGARALRALTPWVGELKKDLTRVGVCSEACRGLEGWRLGCLMAWRGLEGWRLGCLMAWRGLEAWWLGGSEALLTRTSVDNSAGYKHLLATLKLFKRI